MKILKLTIFLSAVLNLSAQDFPFGKYYLPPKSSGSQNNEWKIWELELQSKNVTHKFLGPSLEAIINDLTISSDVDTILHIGEEYHFITKKEVQSGGAKFHYITVKTNVDQKNYKSPLLWQVNAFNREFYFLHQIVDYLSKDTLDPLFLPLYSREEAKQFNKTKPIDTITEPELLKILVHVKNNMEVRQSIYSNLLDKEKEQYSVHRFYQFAIIQSAFFDNGFMPFVTEKNITQWQTDFQSNGELIKLIDKVF
jgi:hypothetical protein